VTDPADVTAPSVRLVPMTLEDFDRWSEQSVAGFAADQVASGVLAEPEATAYARGAFADLLPEGLDTPLHHLFTVQGDADGDGDRTIGDLWLRVRPLSTEVEAFVLDVELAPDVRGRGLGRATMLAAQDAARDLGATVMRLNVFGHNAAARRLYPSVGLRVVRTALARQLGAETPSVTQERAAAALGLRRADADEVASLRRLVASEQAARQRAADVLPQVEAQAQAAAVADEWAASLRSGAALVAEEHGAVLALVRLDEGTHGRRALVHLVGGTDDAASHATLAVLDRLAVGARSHGAVSVEATVHGGEPPVVPEGYRVMAQTMVKRW
jgi:ribosomal protein S18 acetylase RimI-like enzyme